MSEDSVITRIQRYARSPILIGGLIAGTIDIGAACSINKLNPVVILQAIASGVLGRTSFRMGLLSAVLGLVLQWGMSVLIAAIFIGAARRLTILKRRWIGAGLAYGVVVFFIMNYVVVPLSAAKFAATLTVTGFLENMSAMLLFGLIIAFCARENALSAADIV
jgi:uncharacterized membrane protein YagU involved in acid resistance